METFSEIYMLFLTKTDACGADVADSVLAALTFSGLCAMISPVGKAGKNVKNLFGKVRKTP